MHENIKSIYLHQKNIHKIIDKYIYIISSYIFMDRSINTLNMQIEPPRIEKKMLLINKLDIHIESVLQFFP